MHSNPYKEQVPFGRAPLGPNLYATSPVSMVWVPVYQLKDMTTIPSSLLHENLCPSAQILEDILPASQPGSRHILTSFLASPSTTKHIRALDSRRAMGTMDEEYQEPIRVLNTYLQKLEDEVASSTDPPGISSAHPSSLRDLRDHLSHYLERTERILTYCATPEELEDREARIAERERALYDRLRIRGLTEAEARVTARHFAHFPG